MLTHVDHFTNNIHSPLHFTPEKTVFEQFPYNSDLQVVVSSLIDEINSALHLNDQPAVSGIGSFIAFTIAKILPIDFILKNIPL